MSSTAAPEQQLFLSMAARSSGPRRGHGKPASFLPGSRQPDDVFLFFLARAAERAAVVASVRYEEQDAHTQAPC